MACWDIIGKAAGKPVYELMGGLVHERLRTYTYLYPRNGEGEYDYNDVDLAAECAARNVEEGFTAVKFDPAGPYTAYSGHQLSLAVLRPLRDLLPPDPRGGRRPGRPAVRHARPDDALARRSGWRSGSSRSTRSGSRSRSPPGSPRRWRQVAAKTTIPIATGERLTTKYEFYDLLRAGGASILQMNVARVGGLLEAKKIAEHGRGVRRADRTAPLQRPDRGGRQHPARRLHARTS